MGSQENPFFREGEWWWCWCSQKKSNILRGIAYKKGLGQFADLRQGAWKKKRAMRSMKIISSHQAEFSYPAFFELV